MDVSGYGSPVFAFEMAETPAHLEAIFGVESDPNRADRITMMDQGNVWDFGFMILYAAFLALFSLSVYQASKKKIMLVSAVIGLSSGCFDGIENIILLKLTSDFYALDLLKMLWMPVYAKFIAIALSSFGAAYYIYQTDNRVWKPVGAVAVLATLTSFVALASPAQFGWLLKHTIALSWLPMLVFAGYRSFVDNDETNSDT